MIQRIIYVFGNGCLARVVAGTLATIAFSRLIDDPIISVALVREDKLPVLNSKDLFSERCSKIGFRESLRLRHLVHKRRHPRCMKAVHRMEVRNHRQQQMQQQTRTSGRRNGSRK